MIDMSDEIQEVVEQENDIPATEEDADALIEAASNEAAEKNAGIQETVPDAVQEWNGKDWAFNIKGKEVLPSSRDQLKKWAEMGYNAPHTINELKQQINQWKQKESFINENHQKYSEIDGYVKQNPQFWTHVMESWKNKSQVLSDPANPLAQTVGSLQSQVQELVQYKQQIEQQQQQVRVQQEDQAYLSHLAEMKKTYPKVDFDTPDENGKSLEIKVLEYAIENGIKNFKTAFRDFHHDELVKIAAEDAKEKVAREKMKNTKAGIIGKTSTPTKGMSAEVKGKSYADLAQEALRELNIN